MYFQVYVTLEDRNDNPPSFSEREYEASVVSNLPISPPTSVIQLSAEDRDEGENAIIYYDIAAGNEQGKYIFIYNKCFAEIYVIQKE